MQTFPIFARLSEKNRDELDKRAENLGLTRCGLVRRIVEDWLLGRDARELKAGE